LSARSEAQTEFHVFAGQRHVKAFSTNTFLLSYINSIVRIGFTSGPAALSRYICTNTIFSGVLQRDALPETEVGLGGKNVLFSTESFAQAFFEQTFYTV
jgi:hypothetical protein